MTLRLGSRSSPLALAQADLVRSRLLAVRPGVSVEILPFGSRGDGDVGTPLTTLSASTPNLWSDELDRALLSGVIDGAVHSLKDLDLEPVPGITLVSFPEREDARDAWIGAASPRTAGTCSARRSLQLAGLFPKIEIRPIRGTVARRLEQVDHGEFDGTVLAMAGLKRAGLVHRVTRIFSIEEMVPCAGQGILAITARTEDLRSGDLLRAIDDPLVREAALAEREIHRRLGAGLEAPLAVHVFHRGETWHLTAVDFRDGVGSPGILRDWSAKTPAALVDRACETMGIS